MPFLLWCAMPVSFSPTDPYYYLDVLSDAAHGVHAGFTAYSPSTSSCLSRLALLGLLGYFLFLVLVLFTHGFSPETIKRGSMKGRNITPTFVFFLCALVIGAVAALLAPLEHATASGQLPGWLAQQVLTPLFQLMGALRLPTFAFVTLAQCCAVAALIHGCSFALYAALPAVEVEGYVLTEGGDVAVYRLPGFRLLLVGAGAWLLGVHSGAIPATMLWDHAGHIASASCILGLAVSAVFYYRGSLLQEIGRAGLDRRARCPSKDMRKLLGKRPLPRASAAEAAEFNARNPLDHFYCGLSEFNPVVWGVDCKMWLYATGALLLQLNIFSAMAANAAARQEAGVAGGVYSNSCLAIAFCLSFFIAEYMWNEKPHLWTYGAWAAAHCAHAAPPPVPGPPHQFHPPPPHPPPSHHPLQTSLESAWASSSSGAACAGTPTFTLCPWLLQWRPPLQPATSPPWPAALAWRSSSWAGPSPGAPTCRSSTARQLWSRPRAASPCRPFWGCSPWRQCQAQRAGCCAGASGAWRAT